jgi:hypothetical protein
MSAETRINAKLRELADAMRRLAQHLPGEPGAALERCALDLHPVAADGAPPRAPRTRRHHPLH